MPKLKYKYNHETCRYEPFFVKGKVLREKILVFFTLSIIVACIGYFCSIQYFESFDEMTLKQKNQQLKIEWSFLHERILKSQNQLAGLIEKDDHNYRLILDSNPLEASIREAGIGGSEKINLNSIVSFPYMINDYVSLEKLKHQTEIEIQSYKELEKILNNK